MGRSAKGSIALASTLAWVAILSGSMLRIEAADGPGAAGERTKKAEGPLADDAGRREAVKKAAEVYLVLIDKGKYSESWDEASGWFRRGITRRKWIDSLNVTRKPLGRLRSRRLNRIEFRGTEAPDRIDQAWIYSDLKFASGQALGELVVVVFEKEKEWRTSAYFLGEVETLPKPPEKPVDKPAEPAKDVP